MASRVTLVPADHSQKPLLARLMQLYLYEFSDKEAADLEVTEDGLFPYPWSFDAYWEEGSHPFLIRVDGTIAGFVLISRSVPPSPAGHYIAEFFVLRRYRRQGIGTQAARAVFDLFPGHWEVFERQQNAAAQAFWRNVIRAYTRGRYTEDVRAGHEPGYVQRFESRA